jgi:2-polyprenyl-3-methyl-5-hydroxy-6-metoxy-1,4-benzoquinol methylase
VDTLFGGLRERFPGFTFEVLDVSSRPITGGYGLIIMMDVLQHITDEKRFRFALENARSHLAEGGIIIISTNIGEAKRHSFYYVTRPMAAFQRLFEGWRFSEVLEFSGNRMFSVRRP